MYICVSVSIYLCRYENIGILELIPFVDYTCTHYNKWCSSRKSEIKKKLIL